MPNYKLLRKKKDIQYTVHRKSFKTFVYVLKNAKICFLTIQSKLYLIYIRINEKSKHPKMLTFENSKLFSKFYLSCTKEIRFSAYKQMNMITYSLNSLYHISVLTIYLYFTTPIIKKN